MMRSLLIHSVLTIYALMLLTGSALAHNAYLEVRNETHDPADVYCDGEYLGTVQSGETRTFKCSTGDISVRAQGSKVSWGPREFHTHLDETQVWTLLDSEGRSHKGKH